MLRFWGLGHARILALPDDALEVSLILLDEVFGLLAQPLQLLLQVADKPRLPLHLVLLGPQLLVERQVVHVNLIGVLGLLAQLRTNVGRLLPQI